MHKIYIPKYRWYECGGLKTDKVMCIADIWPKAKTKSHKD